MIQCVMCYRLAACSSVYRQMSGGNCTSYIGDAEVTARLADRIAENPRLLGCELCGAEVAPDATLMLCNECRAASALLAQIGVLPKPVPTGVHTAAPGSEKARAQGVSR